MLKIGTEAPDFELKNQDGKAVRLSQYKGKVVVLYFYPKDETPGCTTEACEFRDSMDDLKKYGITVLGVSSDSVESHKKFHEKRRLNFDILSDEKKEVIKKYEADGLLFTKRITYIIDKEQRIAHVFEKVNPNGHSREVLEKVKQLGLI